MQRLERSRYRHVAMVAILLDRSKPWSVPWVPAIFSRVRRRASSAVNRQLKCVVAHWNFLGISQRETKIEPDLRLSGDNIGYLERLF